jgi:hypothetical protein
VPREASDLAVKLLLLVGELLLQGRDFSSEREDGFVCSLLSDSSRGGCIDRQGQEDGGGGRTNILSHQAQDLIFFFNELSREGGDHLPVLPFSLKALGLFLYLSSNDGRAREVTHRPVMKDSHTLSLPIFSGNVLRGETVLRNKINARIIRREC